MIRCNYNSFAFFRKYYHIPESCRLSWALVIEKFSDNTEVRLGIIFTDRPGTYLDVAMRRFFSEVTIFNGNGVRKAFPARRIAEKDRYRFVCEDGLTAEFPKNFIRDIYFTSVYTPDIFRHRLL